MLPILLYPITIPVIIAGVRGTAALLQSPPDEPIATMWIGILGSVRRGVRDARALDVRTADDGMKPMRKAPAPAGRRHGRDVRGRAGPDRPRAIRVDDAARAEDLLLPRALVDGDVFRADRVCGVASAIYLFKGSRRPIASRSPAAELAVLFGLFGLVTGSLWGTQGVGRLVAVGRAPDDGACCSS